MVSVNIRKLAVAIMAVFIIITVSIGIHEGIHVIQGAMLKDTYVSGFGLNSESVYVEWTCTSMEAYEYTVTHELEIEAMAYLFQIIFIVWASLKLGWWLANYD